MKRKSLIFLLALVSATCCIFGLSACDKGGSGSNVVGMFVGEQLNSNVSENSSDYNVEIKYGEQPNLNDYKLFLHYGNGDVKEVQRNDEKISVSYSYYSPHGSVEQTLDQLPSKYLSGSYTIKYAYADTEYTARVNVSVNTATQGNFKINLARNTWYYNEKLPAVTLLNPDNRSVAKREEGDYTYTTDDTTIADGQILDFIAVTKQAYDAIPEEKKTDFDYMYNYIFQTGVQGTDWQYYIPDVEAQLPVGEYMLFAMIGRTYNYKDIVTPAIKIGVKDSFVERKFNFKSVILQDDQGNELTDEDLYGDIVLAVESYKTENIGKFITFKENKEVRGTACFGESFDDKTAEDINYYSVNNNQITLYTGATVDGDNISGNLAGEGVLDGKTLTIKLYIESGVTDKFLFATFTAQ